MQYIWSENAKQLLKQLEYSAIYLNYELGTEVRQEFVKIPSILKRHLFRRLLLLVYRLDNSKGETGISKWAPAQYLSLTTDKSQA